MSALDGNPSATSSVENGSAALPEAPSSGESADVTAEQSVAANDTEGCLPDTSKRGTGTSGLI